MNIVYMIKIFVYNFDNFRSSNQTHKMESLIESQLPFHLLHFAYDRSKRYILYIGLLWLYFEVQITSKISLVNFTRY